MTRGEERERRTGRMLPCAAMLAAFIAVCAVLSAAIGCSFAGPSDYNSYTLQAAAWRDGRMSLGRDYPYLELAVYEGDFYVSFPPVPSVPQYFLTFLFGLATPDALLVKLYAAGGMLAAYCMLLRRKWNRWHAAFMAFMLTLGGSMLPLVLNGAVWYQAQTMAFGLTMCAAALMAYGKTTPGLLLYALAVGCRPFNALYGPLLMLLWYFRQRRRSVCEALTRLAPGVALGLCVAAAYGAYNYVRFGNAFEFGHNYLPEFTSSLHGQFSLAHLGENARRFLLTPPVRITGNGLAFELFGSCVFLANPMLLLLVIWYAADLLCGRATPGRHIIAATFALHLFLLLLHRTGGGYQLGARYAADLVPYSLLYLMQMKGRRRVRLWEAMVLLAGFAMMLVGSVRVHL